MNTRILLIALSLFTPGLLHSQGLITPKTYVYKKTPAGKLDMDVFLPGGKRVRGKIPVIILVHGGALVAGNKSQFERQCAYLAGRGLAAITINYRLVSSMSAPDAKQQVLNCVYDVKSAVRWVKRHARKLGIDTGRVILGGGSAGAYVATLAALDGQINDPGDPDTTLSTHAVALLLDNPAYYADARIFPQPYPLINGDTPPSIEFFGDKDGWMKYGIKFHRALKAAGCSTQLWIAPGQNHAFFNKGDWYQSVLAQSDAFLVSLGLLHGTGIGSPTDALLVPSTE